MMYMFGGTSNLKIALIEILVYVFVVEHGFNDLMKSWQCFFRIMVIFV